MKPMCSCPELLQGFGPGGCSNVSKASLVLKTSLAAQLPPANYCTSAFCNQSPSLFKAPPSPKPLIAPPPQHCSSGSPAKPPPSGNAPPSSSKLLLTLLPLLLLLLHAGLHICAHELLQCAPVQVRLPHIRVHVAGARKLHPGAVGGHHCCVQALHLLKWHHLVLGGGREGEGAECMQTPQHTHTHAF